MSTTDEVYYELREQIDKMPIGMPTTETGVEIRILKHFFTPKEARLALHLNIVLEPIERIYKRAKKAGEKITLEELEEVLNRLAMNGSILIDVKGEKKLYSYAQLAMGMYEFQVDRLTKEFYEDFEEYLMGEFRKEAARTKIPQLRTIPINKSIPHELHVATYEDMRKTIEKTDGKFGVINCVCKQGKDLVGENCKTSDLREVCLMFPSSIEYYKLIESESARYITKEETLEILQRAEDAGLVIQPSNSQEPEFICCCCGDCCALLTAAKQFPKPTELFASNYYAEVDQELCKGCETCYDRCQMDAPMIEEEKSMINLERCIGCGLCVPTCPEEAISLKKKEQITVPPKTLDDLYIKILRKKVGVWGMLKTGIKTVLGQKV